jgi:ArsR family transcriptional regulator
LINREYSDEILQNVSEILGTLAHPLRLKIILHLSQEPSAVSDMINALNVRQPNLSQHLALLKRLKILKTKREGRKILYFLAYPEIKDFIIKTIEFFSTSKL